MQSVKVSGVSGTLFKVSMTGCRATPCWGSGRSPDLATLAELTSESVNFRIGLDDGIITSLMRRRLGFEGAKPLTSGSNGYHLAELASLYDRRYRRGDGQPRHTGGGWHRVWGRREEGEYLTRHLEENVLTSFHESPHRKLRSRFRNHVSEVTVFPEKKKQKL